MGRPSKLNLDVQTRICRLVRAGVDVLDACEAEGVGRRTYYDWLERGNSGDEAYEAYEAFAEAVEQAKAQRNGSLAMVVAKAANGGDWQAAMRLLKAYRPDLHADRSRIEHSGPDGKPIQSETTTKHVITDDEARQIREKVLFGKVAIEPGEGSK